MTTTKATATTMIRITGHGKINKTIMTSAATAP